MATLQEIDESNRGAHYYLTSEDRCYFLHEFTSRKGYAHSAGNQLIINFKKSPFKCHEPQYHYKLQAIQSAIAFFRQIFDKQPEIYRNSTFIPIPPSKLPGDPAYDDRVWQLVRGICAGRNADARELIRQKAPYDAAHLQGPEGKRIKPDELEALYCLDSQQPPKSNVLVFDDVLSAGTHFRAIKSTILAAYPETYVVGFFLARRVLPIPEIDFDI